MSPRLALLALATALAVSACGSDFEPSSRIAKLRLLAVRADRPFARPGEEVSLEGLAVDPAARPLTWAWTTCVNPPSSTATGCLELADVSAVTIGAGLDRHRVRIPGDVVTRLPENARAAALVGVVVVVCPGTIAPGRTGPLPFTCTDPSGRVLGLDETEIGVKRIFVRTRDENRNPTLDSVTWDGQPWSEDDVKEATRCPATTDHFADCDESLAHRIEVRSSGAERGESELGAAFDEQTVVQLYATEGIFEHPVRIASDPATRWVARASTDLVTFWFVVRDDRGGVTWTTRRARAR